MQSDSTRPCPRCGKDRPIYAKGLCQSCYSAAWQKAHPRTTPRPPCTMPGCEKPQLGRGVCSAHYYHLTRQTETRPCSVDGCGQPVRTKGLCHAHYTQAQRTGGDPTGHLPGRTRAICTIEGCGQPAVGRGYCRLHWGRWRRQGDPSVVILQSDKRTPFVCVWCGKTFYVKPSTGQRCCSKACSKRQYPEGEAARRGTHKYRTSKRKQFVAPVNEQAIFDRDKGLCGICGKPVERSKMSLDHILPISKGGTREPKNVRLAHLSCNKGRGNRGHAQLRLLG